MAGDEQIASAQEMAVLAALRGRVYAFLSGLYMQLPDTGLVQRLQNGSLEPLWAALATEEHDDLAAGLALMSQYGGEVRGKPADEALTGLAVDHTRLLRGISQTYGPPPPYESVYRGDDGERRMQVEADVRCAYSQAGVELTQGLGEPADSLGVELGFMHHLCTQEAEAWRVEDVDAAAEWIERQQDFLADHVAVWAPDFCDVMAAHAATNFYRGLARLTKGFLLTDAERTAAMLG